MEAQIISSRPVNAYKRWADRDLKLILSTVASPENVSKWAVHFGRSEKAIVCIYRWAYCSKAHVEHHVSEGVTGIPARAWQIANDLGLVTQGCP